MPLSFQMCVVPTRPFREPGTEAGRGSLYLHSEKTVEHFSCLQKNANFSVHRAVLSSHAVCGRCSLMTAAKTQLSPSSCVTLRLTCLPVQIHLCANARSNLQRWCAAPSFVAQVFGVFFFFPLPWSCFLGNIPFPIYSLLLFILACLVFSFCYSWLIVIINIFICTALNYKCFCLFNPLDKSRYILIPLYRWENWNSGIFGDLS